MIHRATLATFVLAGILSLAVFALKYEVQDLEDELRRLDQALFEERRAVHVLKAEWSHLNDPVRLTSLATRFLGLEPVTPAQIGNLAALPMPASATGSPEAIALAVIKAFASRETRR